MGNDRMDMDESLIRQQEEMLEKYGWYVHYVFSEKMVNVHTHGLEKYHHLDFQVVLPLQQNTVHGILTTLVSRVKRGESFRHNQFVEEVISNFPVKLVKAYDADRLLLRVIFPDPHGKLEQSEMDGSYSQQYKGVWHDPESN
jgi:hypothetical protein